MKHRILRESPLFPAWVGIVETRLHRGAISMERSANARYEWNQLSLTLRQRDAAIEELIRRGVARADVGPKGEVLILRAA